MKNSLFIGFITLVVSISGCTINVDTPSNTAAPASNAPASNTTNSAPKTAENKTVNTATSPKKEDADSAKKTDEPSETKPSGTRVQFDEGETSAQVTKDIPAGGSVDFLINAKKGQMMGYTVGYDFNDSDVESFLSEPGSDNILQSSRPKEPQEFKVNKSGDHRLTVNNYSGKKVTISLYLNIE